MNNYNNQFKQELSDPKSLVKEAIDLSNKLMNITDINNANNIELQSDIYKIYDVILRSSIDELKTTNQYLTGKYSCLVENSDGELRIVSKEIGERLTAEEHIGTLITFAKLFCKVIECNNFMASMMKLEQTAYTAVGHIGKSAIKTWLK